MVQGEDLGYFGPDSVSWRVHREVTVLFGGARAVLMQAAHPLVIAGARETGMYERNPWRRLQRTLVLTYTITFGTKAEAHAAADRINEVHSRVRGNDPVTGLPYDALDPELLLWVHACLVDSALLFEELTVGDLDDGERQRFHEEQMLAAELVMIPREVIPPTVPALRSYVQKVIDSHILQVTDAARMVADLFHHPPKEAEWRPVLTGVSRLAFATLPPELREMYGVTAGPAKRAAIRATFAGARVLRPLLPARYRYIAPYQEWLRRQRGRAPSLNRLLAVVEIDGEGSIDGVLLDIDGVLAVSWEAIPGAAETVEWLRAQGIPFRLITNTTTHTREDLAATLRGAGIGVEGGDIVTAVVMTASYLRAHHPGATVFLLSDGDPKADLEGVELVTEGADVVVIGGAGDDFSYENLNRVFRMVMDGAALVAMHRNMYWRTRDGLQLDGGAYIAGLEEATGTKAVICGKPSPTFFEEAVAMLHTTPDRTAMIGDDIVNDVLGAQAVGLTGILVRTGKFMPADLKRAAGQPDHVIGSIADLPRSLRPS